MAIRPVEMQGMVQRSQDVTHFKASENNRSNVEQMNIQGQQTKELQLKQENVVKKENADYNEQKYDAKEKGHNSYDENKNGHGKRKNKEEVEDGKVTVKQKSTFDVRI